MMVFLIKISFVRLLCCGLAQTMHFLDQSLCVWLCIIQYDLIDKQSPAITEEELQHFASENGFAKWCVDTIVRICYYNITFPNNIS